MPDQPADSELVEYRVAEARKAHALGFVLMAVNGKVPTRKAWQKQPAPSLQAVEALARTGNVALRTGAISGVIEIDDDSGDQSAIEKLGLPTSTATIRTGSGHLNRLFRHPGFRVRNSVSKLAPDIDVRGDGGAAVYVGSLHPETGRPYVWADGLSPDEVGIAELPAPLIEKLKSRERVPSRQAAGTPSRATPKEPNRRVAKYAKRAVRHAVERLSAAQEGMRNDALNKEAFGLGRLVGAGWLHEEDVRPALLAAASFVGLPDAEAAATLDSGLKAGVADPANESVLREPAAGRCPREDNARPAILVLAGQLPAVVSAAEDALLKADREPFFERAGTPVRLVRSATAAKKLGITRPAGSLTMMPIEVPYLVESFMHSAVFQRLGKDGGVVAIDCPEKLARHYLARRGLWKLPHLEQVIEVPIMRNDGTLLVQAGYDPATELYLDSGGMVLPPIADQPTIVDARRALEVLRRPLKDFPFVEASDRAAALAAILTTLVRPQLRTAPAFAFRAPTMSSGKSLLADIVAMVATGRVAPVMTPGNDDEEMRKRITAFLLAGFPMGCIDNVEHPFGGEAICSVLTQGVYRDRVLGKSEMATLPTAVVWTITGNNLVLVGDITTRVVVCDLDPQVERPEERPFDVDLYSYVPAHRGALVAAGLTILRAYHLAGRPNQHLPVFGRFVDWSSAVRSALVWLGEADACAGMARLRAIDPVREQLRLVLHYWHQNLGTAPLPAADVIDAAQHLPEGHEFRRALEDACRSSKCAMDGRRFGHWLAKIERRTEDGLQCVRMGSRQGVSLWSVRPVSPPSVGCVGSVGSSPSVGDGSGNGDEEHGEPAPDSGCPLDDTDYAVNPDMQMRPRPREKNPRNPPNPPGMTVAREVEDEIERELQEEGHAG